MIFNNAVYGMKYVYVIHFKINETTYTALENMTWQEWLDSEYNTDRYEVYTSLYGDVVIGKSSDDMGIYDKAGYVKSSDTIMAQFEYAYEKN